MTARRRGRGGQTGWEPRVRVRDRERQVLSLEAEGLTQDEIAHRLAISQPAVSKILARVDARTIADLAARVAAHRARQIRHLQHVGREALKAWERSKRDATRRSQRTRAGHGAGGETTSEIVVATRHGDPRYLTECRKALADLRILVGLDVAALDGRARVDPYAQLTEAQLRALWTDQQRLLTDEAAGDGEA